jgi:DNA-binding CsgD family transcriptional regulator
MPWYSQSNKIIGVIGCSIALGRHSLAESISILTSLGLLDQNKIQQPDVVTSPQLKINQIHLSQRELQCLKLTLKGFTSKKIAQQLGISFRTVEEYLLNVRIKSGAGSKAELIGMMMDSFI